MALTDEDIEFIKSLIETRVTEIKHASPIEDTIDEIIGILDKAACGSSYSNVDRLNLIIADQLGDILRKRG